jgi:hypothetical protein
MLNIVKRLLGHVSGFPSGVADQSIRRMSAATSELPGNNE